MDMPEREPHGQSKANFMDEFKGRTMANAIVTFLKGFPGFSDWWFTTLDEGRRKNLFIGIQICILNSMNRVSGLSMDRAKGIKDGIVSFFNALPGFTQWETTVLGSTLSERVNHQLTMYIYKELKRG
jgi:hypothetical protein